MDNQALPAAELDIGHGEVHQRVVIGQRFQVGTKQAVDGCVEGADFEVSQLVHIEGVSVWVCIRGLCSRICSC